MMDTYLVVNKSTYDDFYAPSAVPTPAPTHSPSSIPTSFPTTSVQTIAVIPGVLTLQGFNASQFDGDYKSTLELVIADIINDGVNGSRAIVTVTSVTDASRRRLRASTDANFRRLSDSITTCNFTVSVVLEETSLDELTVFDAVDSLLVAAVETSTVLADNYNTKLALVKNSSISVISASAIVSNEASMEISVAHSPSPTASPTSRTSGDDSFFGGMSLVEGIVVISVGLVAILGLLGYYVCFYHHQKPTIPLPKHVELVPIKEKEVPKQTGKGAHEGRVKETAKKETAVTDPNQVQVEKVKKGGHKTKKLAKYTDLQSAPVNL